MFDTRRLQPANPAPGERNRGACGPQNGRCWRRWGPAAAIQLLSAALLATQTWQIVETSRGLRFGFATAQAQTPAPSGTPAAATPATAAAPATATATVAYDAVYGGVNQTTTADGTTLKITRDGDGYNPVAVAYSGAQSGTLTFQYAPGDTRTVESDGDGATHLVYAGDYLPMAEFGTGADAASRYHFPGRGQITVGSGQPAGSELFAITERLGSTRALLSGGAVQARFDYDTLGKPTETDSCASACTAREYAWRYQSHRYILLADAGEAAAYRADKAASFQASSAGAGYQPGLPDFKARFYDHGQGRFLNTDLAGASISPYTAMGNDWVNNIDPDGLMPRRSRAEFEEDDEDNDDDEEEDAVARQADRVLRQRTEHGEVARGLARAAAPTPRERALMAQPFPYHEDAATFDASNFANWVRNARRLYEDFIAAHDVAHARAAQITVELVARLLPDNIPQRDVAYFKYALSYTLRSLQSAGDFISNIYVRAQGLGRPMLTPLPPTLPDAARPVVPR